VILIDRPGHGLQNLLYDLILLIIVYFKIYNRGMLMLIFKYSEYTDPYSTYESTFESTSREVTRIKYPVTRSTYLENFLCQTNKPSVLLKSFVPSPSFCRTVRNIILKLTPINIRTEWRCFTFKYIGFHIRHVLPPPFSGFREKCEKLDGSDSPIAVRAV
jgi:hypothetical protein